MQSCNSFNVRPKIHTDVYCNELPYTLLNNVCYKSNPIGGKIKRIYISKGFRWNGADILPAFWIVGSRFQPEYLWASMIHDFCCKNKHKFTNKEASIIFRDLLILCNVGVIKANIMMFFVYVFQGLFFNKGWKE